MKALFWAAIIALAANAAPAWSTTNDWTVYLDDRNLTAFAEPLPSGSQPLLNATAIGPALSIVALQEGNGFALQDAEGRNWRWTSDAGSLVSESGILPLSSPAIQQGSSLFLTPETIAELSHLRLSVDESSKQITFNRTSSGATQDLQEGWHSFSVPKTPAPTAVVKRPKALAANPPPTHERLNLGVGLGYAQNSNWGIYTTANGKLAGGKTDLWTLITKGNKGLRLHNSHLTWLGQSTAIELGDLYSESWGLIRGARYSWDNDPDRSLGIYLKTERTQNPRPLLAYRDSFELGRNLAIRGEIGSDRSSYANASFKIGSLECLGFFRQLPDDLGESAGLFASLQLTPRMALFSSADFVYDSQGGPTRSRTFGLRLPVYRNWNLVLQQTGRWFDEGEFTARSIGLSVPIAHSINLYMRYQANSTKRDFLASRLINTGYGSSGLMTSLSLAVNPRMRLNYQVSHLSHQGQTTTHEQLVTSYRLSSTTSIQAFSGFPNIGDRDLLRVRLDHRLRDNLSVLLDYGRLVSYQDTDSIQGKRGLMVMLQTKWPCWVPAVGGRVEGTVCDQLGQPLPGISIKLGDYSAVTDSGGHYLLNCIPPGAYPIGIARESIPADYKAISSESKLAIADDTRLRLDFSLVPLASISGRVYLDTNGNRAFDPGEGVQGIAVMANDRATGSNNDGSFGFYNLEPGKYLMRIVPETLGRNYKLPDASTIPVELLPGESITDIQFRLEEQKKPIVFTQVVYGNE